ncbi:hypothetical protein BLNAU_23615 [Blattamonas nauphoetae]|uniref:Protein kinase domain-containing protein n=1 Tax=Blattamonas nauphoetae TaxID=2049346 RepID=A0ABQ9WPP8_9EUKA|nr:hypothetical protein BLNAU_23615 [Blattamonas nauphoetae]
MGQGRPDAVYGILDVDPGTNLKLLMDRWKNEQKQWTDDDLLLLVVQLVYPLKYMHTKFIHRAIRSDCIFLETAKPAVFANLQYALRYNQESGTKTSAPYLKNGLGQNTPFQPSSRIRPRETNLDDPLYDSRVDIWAIGLILHEIAYGKSIFGNANDIQTTKKILDNKFDITQYDPLHPKFHAILKRMLSTDADARPTAASLLQDPQLQPAYNFLTSVPAVPMIKTNASSILNSAIPQETFPDDLRTRQNRFVQSMASPQAAENVAISVDSASPTESTTKATSSSNVDKEGAELGAVKGIRAVFVAGVLVVGALVAGVFAGDGSLLAVELLVAVVAGALGAAALGARILGTGPLVTGALVAIALVAGALVARVVEGACSLFQGKCVIGPLVAGVASGALVARLVAEPLGAKRVLGAGALVAGALVSGVVADELASGSVERQYGVGALVAGALATGVLVAGVLVAGVVAGAHVQGVRGAGALGAGALVAGTFAAGAILAEVVQRARITNFLERLCTVRALQEQALFEGTTLVEALVAGALGAGVLVAGVVAGSRVTGPLGAGTLTAGARVVGALFVGALGAGGLVKGALGAGAIEAGVLIPGVLGVGALVAGVVAGARVEDSLGARVLVAGALAAGALVAQVEAGGCLAGTLVAGTLGAGALVAGARVAGALGAEARVEETQGTEELETGALVAGALGGGSLGAGLLTNEIFTNPDGMLFGYGYRSIPVGTVMAAALGACGGIFGVRLYHQRYHEQPDK